MGVKERRVPYSGPRPWTMGYNANWQTVPGRGVVTPGVNLPIQYLETTDSSGHPGFFKPGASVDSGGDFTTVKIREFRSDSAGQVLSVNRFGYSYSGDQYPIAPKSAMDYAISMVTPSSNANLEAKGTTAISKCIPTNPTASGAVFLGELKQGLPKLAGKELFKSKLKDYRKVGSEYLNIEFGWKPLISDLMAFGKATIESEKIIKQLERDSGKNIRRKYTFPDEVSNSTTRTNNILADCNGLGVYPYCYVNPSGGSLFADITTTTKTWFSGAFTYHFDLKNSKDNLERWATQGRQLYGLELTPEVVWNLIPWSWAVDWEGNIGNVLHNVSRFAQDGLVMRYGYIMQQKTCKIDYTLTSGGSIQEVSNPAGKTLRMTVIAESKVRRTATPFGFGFDMKALTGRQSAILGALGISRGPNRLK